MSTGTAHADTGFPYFNVRGASGNGSLFLVSRMAGHPQKDSAGSQSRRIRVPLFNPWCYATPVGRRHGRPGAFQVFADAGECVDAELRAGRKNPADFVRYRRGNTRKRSFSPPDVGRQLAAPVTLLDRRIPGRF